MRIVISLLLVSLLCGCGSGDSTEINFASGPDSSVADDPIAQSECGGSDDQCGQQID